MLINKYLYYFNETNYRNFLTMHQQENMLFDMNLTSVEYKNYVFNQVAFYEFESLSLHLKRLLIVSVERIRYIHRGFINGFLSEIFFFQKLDQI